MTPVPWARPRFELALLGIVAVVALSQVYVVSTQDASRLCLSRALSHGRLTIEPCAGQTTDRVIRKGRTYSDKAPGISLLALPVVAAVGLGPSFRWTQEGDLGVWAVRVLTGGASLLLLAFAVGRVSEGIAPGWGGAALVTFSLGTLAGPLAATTFGHDTTATAGFAAFLLAWRRRPLPAGLLAGSAVLLDYTGALLLGLIAAYVVRSGLRPALRYALGATPPLLLLGAYDWAAFGSPFHVSYRYVRGQFGADQSGGLFGVHLPTAHGIHDVFFGDLGLLVVSPVLVTAADGLVLLSRTHRVEAIFCGVVAAAFVLVNTGYFLPYGGISPGPRFIAPALPFLALGLGPAFTRWRTATTALAAVSVVATTAVLVTWAGTLGQSYRDTVWGEIVRAVRDRGSSRLVSELSKNLIVWAGPNRIVAAALVAALAAAVFVWAVATGYRGGANTMNGPVGISR